ncbi:hypothetical protein [Prosthecobacter sp.]|uniref:hypothetical protein n=1 Tax=Prosthecobacter sp. TaxID=1965333 RepID=UPI003782F0C8
MKLILPYQKLLACLTLSGLFLSSFAQAKNGATDPIPGTSKGATNSGGGGGGGGGGKSSSTTVTLPPVPSTPIQPLVTGTLTFTAGSYNGSTPTCGGTYRIDPYYPTLSLITVDVSVSSLSTSDGSPLFIIVNGAGGTFYPFLGGSMSVTGGSAKGTSQIYCTPGSSITSVSIVDLNGTVVATGK